MNIAPRFRPVLDPSFVPASLWNRAYAATVRDAGGGEPFALALERSDGSVSVFRTRVLPRWLGGAAAVTAAALAINGAFLNTSNVPALLLFIAWTLAASLYLLRMPVPRSSAAVRS